MRYKLLGHSGLRVSQICLGTMTFGDDWGWGAPAETSREIFDTFLQAGGNFIDTANVYTNGTSEKILHDLIKPQRDRLVLATKYTLNFDSKGDPNGAGNHRKSMMLAVEESLKRLGTDYIDLYWMHVWDQSTPVEEVMRGFEDLVRQGKILYCGISDAPAWIVSYANALAHFRGWAPFVALQIEYSLAERTVERDLIPMAHAFNMAITPWSPLAAGVLTGKYSRHGDRKSSRGGEIDEEKLRIAETVAAVAKDAGATSAQVALAWLIQQPGAVIPIVGATKVDQLQDSLGAVDVKLTEAQMQQLNEASQIDPGFPGRFTPLQSRFSSPTAACSTASTGRAHASNFVARRLPRYDSEYAPLLSPARRFAPRNGSSRFHGPSKTAPRRSRRRLAQGLLSRTHARSG